MLTPEDIKNLTEFQKTVFVTKADFAGLRQDFSKLQTSVMTFAKGTKDNADEIKVVNSRVTTTENWIKQAGPKIGLEYKP